MRIERATGLKRRAAGGSSSFAASSRTLAAAAMKRRTLEEESDAASEAAMRAEFLRVMNSTLSDKTLRQDLKILPTYLFSSLVYTNAPHMRWDAPERVFDEYPDSRVALNSAALAHWLATKRVPLPLRDGRRQPTGYTESDLYRHLFVDNIEFVPWGTFTAQFLGVARDTVRAIRAAQVADPKRITVLMLKHDAVNKSNAWLTGFAWKTLAPVVDFVVSDDRAVIDLMARSMLHTRRGPDDPLGLLERIKSTAQQALQLLTRLWRAVPAEAPSANDTVETIEERRRWNAFVNGFSIDIIYVDDMIYSGQQASDALFGKTFENSSYSERVKIHVLAPYIADYGYRVLKSFSDRVGGIAFPDSVVHVPSYGTRVAALLQRLSQEYVLPPALLKFAKEHRPAIVFEHKVADLVSLPAFLGDREVHDPADLDEDDELPSALRDMPRLVYPTTPFYKRPAFAWHGRRDATGVLVSFAGIDTLFAAAQMQWAAAPPCVRCSRPIAAPLRCGGCGVLPYCSTACHAAYSATPVGLRHAHWCRRLAALAGTLQ